MAFEHSTRLRHLPFFDEVASLEEHQPGWRAATGALVTLRLVDAWIEEGPLVVAPDSECVAAVRRAIDAIDDGSTLPALLHSIVSSLQEQPHGDGHEVMSRLFAFGRALEYENKLQLSLDVYDTIIRHTHPLQDSDIAVSAHIRRGFCLRTLSRFSEALEAYATARAVADQCGDLLGVLRAQIGDANVAGLRGNMGHADSEFAAVAERAAALGFGEARAHALEGRSAAAGYRGDHELAIQFAYEALQASTDPGLRDRILNNIGTAFHMLGLRTAARDAFLVLSATAQEQYIRWSAMLALMTLAAEDGSEPMFHQVRRRINTTSMPPDMKVDYFIHLGRAHRELRQEDLAQIAFAKAIELAEHHGLSRHLFEAEAELHAGARHADEEPAPMPESLAPVAEAVYALRRSAVAEGI